MWGIIPAAGQGTRIQPLAFSKELLPVGSRIDERGVERPRAVSEYLVERLIEGGATKLCFVISPGKSDILGYYGGTFGAADIAYAVQDEAAGLCDAIFRALPLIGPDETVAIGLPDTVWFPADALRALPDEQLSFLLFPVEHPELFDAVVVDDEGRVRTIEVKAIRPHTHWIWGAFKMPGRTLHALADLWRARDRSDLYIGTLVNAWIAAGGAASGVRAGESYVDVGTLNGFREATLLLEGRGGSAVSLPLGARPGLRRLA
ncbi:MAG TPA: sugar phosphate nucleotidyltransferase [Acetobacteraceae bacterium]|jgi:dTDP-glucose pyrophosphorylase|nr:sugar phosphate nucleotidyltransferase [Acetobacteraceae bacterium]